MSNINWDELVETARLVAIGIQEDERRERIKRNPLIIGKAWHKLIRCRHEAKELLSLAKVKEDRDEIKQLESEIEIINSAISVFVSPLGLNEVICE